MHDSFINLTTRLKFSGICVSSFLVFSVPALGDSRLKEFVDFVEANNRSWRSYDVLIKEEIFADEESLSETTRTTRIKVDLDLKRAISITKVQTSVIGSEGAQTQEKLIVKAIDDGKLSEWGGGRKSTVKRDSFLDAFAECQFPQIRCIGMETFPHYPIPSQKGAQFSAFWRILRVEFKDLAVSQKLASKTDVVVTRRTPDKRFAMALKWSFDHNTLMPVALSKTHILREGQSDEIRYTAERSKVEWKEYEGFSLPVKVEVEGLSKSGNLKFNTVKLNWLNVNQGVVFPTEEEIRSAEYWHEQLKVAPDTIVARTDEEKEERP